MTDRKVTQGTAITTFAATDKFYIVPAGGTVPWGYITGANLAGYISAGAGTAMYPTGTFVTGGYLYFNGGTVLTDSNVLTASGTATLTNKRITKRVASTTDDATAVIDSDSYDQYFLTAIANATEFTITGTPTTGQTIFIGLKDAGVSKALTWTGITALGVTLPTATTAGKIHIIGLMYIFSAWYAISVSVQA